MITQYSARNVLAVCNGLVRTEMHQGRAHFVAPIVAMVEGVVHAMNSSRPEFVSADELRIDGWEGRPVFVNHPMVGGIPVASKHPSIAHTSIGFTKNPRVEDARLLMEVWIDKAKCDGALAERMLSGDPFDVSMGAFVQSRDAVGEYKGKKYAGTWHDIDPDHMALLPDSRGACSWEAGCGLRAAMESGTEEELRVLWPDKSGIDDHGRAATAHDNAAKAHEAAAVANDRAYESKVILDNSRHPASKDIAAKEASTTASAAKEASTAASKATERAVNQSEKTGKGQTGSQHHADHAMKTAKNGDHQAAANAHRAAAREHMASAERHGMSYDKGSRNSEELRTAWVDKSGVDDHGRGAAAAATSRATKASAAAKDSATHGIAQRAHEAAAREHDAVVTRMIGYGTVVPNTVAAGHHAIANGHRLQAQNHYHTSLGRAAEEGNVEFYAGRNIDQATRDKMDKADFAGPNESFPIEIAGDVHDAAQSIGRAKGDRAAIKAKIISIAYRKGFQESLPEDWKKKVDQKHASGFASMMAAAKELFRSLLPANKMGERDLAQKLYDAIKELEPNCTHIVDWYPITDPAHVVYSVWEPSTDSGSEMGMGYTSSLYERAFSIADSGVVTMNDARIEVAPQTTYEPVEGASPVVAGTCGCGGNKAAEETDMEKKDRIKALIAKGSSLITASDQTMLESATDEQLTRFEAAVAAELKAAAEAKEADMKAAKTAADLKAAKDKTDEDARLLAAAKAGKGEVTFEEVLAKASPEVQASFKAMQDQAAAKKTATIASLKAAGARCTFTDAQLNAMEQGQLDALVVLADIKPATDHSLVMPPASRNAADHNPPAVTNESMNAKFVAARVARG